MEKSKIYVPLNIQRFASGSIPFSVYETGSYGITFEGKIEWSSNSNGSVANSSTVYCDLYARKQKASSATTGKSWSGSITIDGTPSSFSSLSASTSIKNDWVKVHSFSKTVSHNANGTKGITISGSVKGPSGTSLANATSSGSAYVTLDTIPRYPSVDQWGVSSTEETVTMGWSSDSNIDYLWYSFRATDGSHSSNGFVGGRTVSGTSGTYTISGLYPNKEYSIVTKLRRSDSQLSDSFFGDTLISTYPYPYATSMPNFTIGNTLTIGIYNPLRRRISVHLVLPNNEEVGGDVISGDSISGYVGDSFKDALYRSIPNSPSGTYKVKITYNGHPETRTGGTFTINYNDSKPVFSHFDFYDINEVILSLTQNNKTIVDKYSTVRVSVVGNEAQGYKGASITSYTVLGKSFSTTYDIYNFSGTSIKVYANDSRGNSNYVDLPITSLLNYFDITKGNFGYERSNGGVGTQVTFVFDGDFWNNNFGAVHNSLSAKYRLKRKGTSEFGEEKQIDTSLLNISENGTFTFENILAGDMAEDNGFDIESSYTVEITLSDKLSSATYTYTVIEGSPAFDLVGNCIALGGYYNEDIGGRVQINNETTLWEGNAQIASATGGYKELSDMPNISNYVGKIIRLYISYGSWEAMQPKDIYVAENTILAFVAYQRDYSGTNDVWNTLFCFGNMNTTNWNIKTNLSYVIENTTIEVKDAGSYGFYLRKVTLVG